MSSAEAARLFLRIVVIKLLLSFGCLPERNEMVVFALTVFANFEDERIEPPAHPTDGTILTEQIGALVEVVRISKYLTG